MELLTVTYESLMENMLLYVALTMALVAFFKELLALEGNKVRLASFIIGVLMSALVYVGQAFPVFSQYVEAVFFILATGLFASGFFDLGVSVRNGG